MDTFKLITKRITNESKTKEIDNEFIQIWQSLFNIIKPELTSYKLYKLVSSDKPKIIFTMTTCKRFNLFTQTINSIFNTWTDIQLVDKFIIVDDNSSAEDRTQMVLLYPFINFIMKSEEEKGHLESMNIIYNELKKYNPSHWIHIEDDFLFFNSLPYITYGMQGLTELQHFNVKQIMFNRNYVETFDKINMSGHIPYNNNMFSLHDYKQNGFQCQYWPYFSFRPSIINVEAILNLGDFTSSNAFFEMAYANKWKDHGYKTAFFNFLTNIHIGKLCNTSGENAYTLNNVSQFGTYNNYNIKVINMNDRQDRLDRISKILNNEKIQFERIEAVDGKSLTLTPELHQLFNGNDFGLRRGVVGCALSHYNLWKKLVESNDSYYVIMEDDVTLCTNFNKYISKLIINPEYNLLFTGYHSNSSNFKNEINESVTIKSIDTDKYIGGTHCYIITKQGATALINYIKNNGIKHGIDYLMVKVQKDIQVHETVPHITYADWVTTRDSNVDSNIQHDYSPVSLSVSDKYIFLEKLDQIDNDCYVAEKHLPKCDYETMADSIDACVAFNTLGYFKNKITELTQSPYFSNNDGIYINKDYYFNTFKKKE